jgi:hypothetical protein
MEWKMNVPRFSSAGSNKSGLPDEAFVVESELERDLAVFASRLAQYKEAGASEEMCEAALSGTGLRLVNVIDKPLLGVTLPIVGAVVSGTLWISYFIPRRHPAAPQKPVLSKMISEGSSFYISRDMDADFAAAPNTLLVVRDDAHSDGAGQIYLKAPVETGVDLPSLSHGDLLNQIDVIDFENVSDLVAIAQPLLAEIASRRDLLRELVSSARSDPKLRGDCELLDEFYKYVLHRARNDARLRLHVFRPDVEVSPHAHRWAMVSYVLSGPCATKYYGIESEVASSPEADVYQVHISHRLQAGTCYAFGDTLVHWFLGAPGSATLTLRGPAVKQKAAEFRPEGLIPKFGIEANMEPSLSMTTEQFEYGVRHLEMTNVL